jgi:N4-(beta-N-acetylglucosaminyl)-L-asparaginase
MKRRIFVKSSLAVGAATSLLSLPACSKGQEKKEESEPKGIFYKYPLVLSTWNNAKANDAAFEVLLNKGDIMDAVVNGIKVPEADPEDRSVGYGGRPDRSGNVTLDACIMNQHGKAGSVTYVQHFMHPIEIARKVMETTPHVMLSGSGAEMFALNLGMKKTNLLTEASKKEFLEWKKTSHYKPIINIERHDTIGLLAMDANANIAGGCSTSGMAYKMEGRVGDSPIIGAGLFVDNEVGACTATGNGEYLLRTLGAFLVVELMRNGKTPQQACEEAIKRVIAKHKDSTEEFQIGLIALNKKGEIGFHAVRKGFVIALKSIDKQILLESKFEII